MCNKKQTNWPYQQLTMSGGYGVFFGKLYQLFSNAGETEMPAFEPETF